MKLLSYITTIIAYSSFILLAGFIFAILWSAWIWIIGYDLSEAWVIGFVFEYFAIPLLNYSKEIFGTVANWSTILLGLIISVSSVFICAGIASKLKASSNKTNLHQKK